jgi:polysaccharide biosynthesis protein PslH
MTSLVLTHYRPERPTSGAPLRNWQNIKALASFGPVDVVTVGVDETPQAVKGIREWAPFSLRSRSAWDRLKTKCAPLRPGIHPGVDMYSSTAVRSWLRQRAGEGGYDIALIETIVLAAYGDELRRAARRVVFDAHNIEGTLQPTLDEALFTRAEILRGIKHRVLSGRLRAAERRAITRADLVWVCSDTDAKEVSRLYGRRTGVTVVPNGVDVDAYRRAAAPRVDADWSARPVTMVYPGFFSYPPNEDAALRLIQHVLPAVRARGYAARVVVAGRNPTPAILAAAARDAAVEVTGAVESMVPYLEQPCVVTLPITVGSGTRLKIIEAFAVGRPVVSSAKGVEGIDAVDGTHLLIRDQPEHMAQAVVDLWKSPSMRAQICKSALELTRLYYSWSAATDRIATSLGLGVRQTEFRTAMHREHAAAHADGKVH